MNSVQHKLLNHEVPPPGGTWQKIADELEDAGAGYQFPKRLHDLAIEPVPATAWQEIAAALDNAGTGFQFPRTLQELEVPPPAGTWNQLQQQLEANASAAEKLLTAAVLPPVDVWEKIEQELSTAKEEQPVKRRVIPFWKYAAAAAILGFLTFGTLQYFRPGTSVTAANAGTMPVPVVEALNHATAGMDAAAEGDHSSALHTDIGEARDNAALEASKKTYARLSFSPKRKAAMAAAFRFAESSSSEDFSEHGDAGYEEALGSTETNPQRYIVLMTPDGHFIRVSRKLSNLVCCVSGEEQDKDCRTMVDNWRKQLACSDASHPGNFMDILNLVNSLQEQ